MKSARSVRIGYAPFFAASAEKGYTVRMREALGAFGDVVPFRSWRATLIDHLRTRTSRLDFLVLNWTDNDLLDRGTKTVASRKVVRLFATTIAMRLVAKRLVFVRHNVYPHAVATGHERIAQRWVDRYERLFDTVLTHSGDDSQRSRHYCPHPLYRTVSIPSGPSTTSLPDRYFVAFGRIVRYKHLERLIDAWPDGRTLLVIGAVADLAYANELVARARANVIVRPGMIDEAEAQAIVSRSAGLLIAHADRDVIVSSSFFFAMSLPVRVIAVATPFLRWIQPRVGAGLLRIAPDVATLCEVLDDDASEVVPDTAAIEREFGDRAVNEALRLALHVEVATKTSRE